MVKQTHQAQLLSKHDEAKGAEAAEAAQEHRRELFERLDAWLFHFDQRPTQTPPAKKQALW